MFQLGSIATSVSHLFSGSIYISKHDSEGLLLFLHLTMCQRAPRRPQGYSLAFVLYPQPITYPRDTVKINHITSHLCLMDKINLGVVGYVHQRQHTALYYLPFLVVFIFQIGNAFFPTLKNIFFYCEIFRYRKTQGIIYSYTQQ